MYQQSLPRLPIPGIEDTCKRYVDALKPILSEEELRFFFFFFLFILFLFSFYSLFILFYFISFFFSFFFFFFSSSSPLPPSNTTTLIEQFKNGEGKILHEKLLAHDKQNHGSSFINEFWDDMYFCLRAPLPLNVNPFIQLTKKNDDGFFFFFFFFFSLFLLFSFSLSFSLFSK